MKTKHVVIILVCVVLVGAYAISIAPNFRHRSEWNQTVKTLRSLSPERVRAAVQGFARDRKASGKPLPATVGVQDLVSSGYLRADEVTGLSGAQTTVALDVDESTPQMIWIRVQFPDGCSFAEMADGSIQGLPK
jgi:type II secretory pathway component PulM